MPKQFLCNLEELEELLNDTCTEFFEALGYAMNTPELTVMHEVVEAALQFWASRPERERHNA